MPKFATIVTVHTVQYVRVVVDADDAGQAWETINNALGDGHNATDLDQVDGITITGISEVGYDRDEVDPVEPVATDDAVSEVA